MVDSAAQISPVLENALAFYRSNYAVAFYVSLTDRAAIRPVGLPSRPRTCRFCRRSEPHATFAQEAHAIPRCVGNRNLLTYEECDECNTRFSRLEDDLAKFTLPARTFGRVRAYRGIPSLAHPKDQWRVDALGGDFKIRQLADRSIFTEDEETKELHFRIPLQKHRPLGVYKAFLKMALSVAPRGELDNFDHAMKWLLTDGVSEKGIYPLDAGSLKSWSGRSICLPA